MTTQQPLDPAIPLHHLTTLAIHPVHVIAQFLFQLAGTGQRPRPTFSLGRQFGHHRRILAVVLRGHTVKNLRVIRGLFGTDPLGGQPDGL